MADSKLSPIKPTPAENTHPQVAHAPFHEPRVGADVVLRSSDAVDFYAHKVILSLASPFFEEMFQLPQPADNTSLPIIEVPEDATTVDFILRTCYPFTPPSSTSLIDARRAFEAALKYEMKAVQSLSEAGLKTFVKEDPLGVFVLGCRYEREDVCRAAAACLLQHSLQSLESEELRQVSAYQYHKLVQWHGRCCGAAFRVVFTRGWLEHYISDEILSKTFCGSCLVPDKYSAQWYANQRLWDYFDRARDTLVHSPSGAAITSDKVLHNWSNIYCPNHGRKDLSDGGRKISNLLAQEVDRVVAEIPIPKFCE
ncbi:hypothetical protein DENSPDRAFT_854056 [Dentipellis sp. KUC8613]|nr:hypothetical protein DENSPDRAFT_854056 [Dentipellis sp. KUC8613]